MKNINDNDLNLMLDLADSMQPNLPGINCKGIAREFYQDEKGATSLMKYLMDLILILMIPMITSGMQ